MGKGLIVGGGDAGLYTIKLIHEKRRIERRIETIDLILSVQTIVEEADRLDALNIAKAAYNDSLVALNIAINGFIAETVTRADLLTAQKNALAAKGDVDKAQALLDTIRLKKLALQKEKEYLQNHNPDDEVVQAWCTDFTTDLAGDVGTIEIPGERNGIPVLIKPGYLDKALYNAQSDGQLQYTVASTPAAVFWNKAMLPGFQKWRPTYRIGTITTIDEANDLCSVTLDSALSSEQSLPINFQPVITDVPIQYMYCHAAAFEVGDRVIVKYAGQIPALPIVIGFESNPVECLTGEFIGLALSDTENLGRFYFKKTTGSWTAESTTQLAGNVDWKGTNDLDVLTWYGPDSRYFYKAGFPVVESGDAILKGGLLWCQLPDNLDVYGCAIAYTPTKVLNAITCEGGTTFKVYQRAYSETYPNNNVYDVSTNPLGWKLLDSITPTRLYDSIPQSQYFLTICPFNQSGNQCHGIIGQHESGNTHTTWHPMGTDVLTVDITGETVVFTIKNASGSYHRDENNSATLNEDDPIHTVTNGQDISSACGFSGPVYDPSVVTDTNHRTYTKTYDSHISDIELQVICCDYKGDIPVFAEILTAEFNSWNQQEAGEFTGTNRTTDTYPGCVLHQQIDSERNESFSRSDRLTAYNTYLQFDNLTIPLHTDSENTDIAYNFSHDTSQFNPQTQPDVNNASGNYSLDSIKNVEYRWIHYLDIRNKTAGFNREQFTRTIKQRADYVPDPAPALTASWSLTVGTDIQTTLHAHEIMVNGVTTVINTENPIETNNPYETISGSGYSDPNETELAGYTNSYDIDQPAGGLAHVYLHGMIKLANDATRRQSWASSFVKQAFLSLDKWQIDNANNTQSSYSKVGTYNYLADADPVTLTGLIGDNPRFRPIGVVK